MLLLQKPPQPSFHTLASRLVHEVIDPMADQVRVRNPSQFGDPLIDRAERTVQRNRAGGILKGDIVGQGDQILPGHLHILSQGAPEFSLAQ